MTRSRTAALLSSLSLWVLLALAGGLTAGAAAQVYGIPGGTGAIAIIDAVGQLWLNALRMTIIPLVFSLLVTGIASIADAAATGRLALKAVTDEFPKLYDYLESQIDGPYLVGGAFSIADIAVATTFHNLRLAKEPVDASRWPKLAAYIDATLSRPSFVTAIAAPTN